MADLVPFDLVYLRLDGSVPFPDGGNIMLGTTTGTKIATGPTQKLGFFGATPVVQRPGTNDLKQSLVDLGLIVGAASTPLNLNGGNLFTSGTITGVAGVVAGSNTGVGAIQANGAAGGVRSLSFLTAGVFRWIIRANATAEGGSDAGSDLEIVSRTDAGAALGTIITITRSTGLITLGGTLSVLTSSTAGAGLRLPHGGVPTSPVNGDVWTTNAGLFVRVNGATVGPLT